MRSVRPSSGLTGRCCLEHPPSLLCGSLPMPEPATSVHQPIAPPTSPMHALEHVPMQVACPRLALLLYIRCWPKASSCWPYGRSMAHTPACCLLSLSNPCFPPYSMWLCRRIVHHPSGEGLLLGPQLTRKLWVLLQQRHQGIHILVSVLQAVAVLSNLNQSLCIGCADL